MANHSDSHDTKLVARLRSGDEAALAEFVEANRPALTGFLRTYFIAFTKCIWSMGVEKNLPWKMLPAIPRLSLRSVTYAQ